MASNALNGNTPESEYPALLASYLTESLGRMTLFGEIVKAASENPTMNALHPGYQDFAAQMINSVGAPVTDFLRSGYRVKVPAPSDYPSDRDLYVAAVHQLRTAEKVITVFATPSLDGHMSDLPPVMFPIGIPTFIEAVRNSTLG